MSIKWKKVKGGKITLGEDIPDYMGDNVEKYMFKTFEEIFGNNALEKISGYGERGFLVTDIIENGLRMLVALKKNDLDTYIQQMTFIDEHIKQLKTMYSHELEEYESKIIEDK